MGHPTILERTFGHWLSKGITCEQYIQDTLTPKRHIYGLFLLQYIRQGAFNYMDKSMMKNHNHYYKIQTRIWSKSVVSTCTKRFQEIRNNSEDSYEDGARDEGPNL